jgi:hypothetical protein
VQLGTLTPRCLDYVADCALPPQCTKGNTDTCVFNQLDASKGVQCEECSAGFYIGPEGNCVRMSRPDRAVSKRRHTLWFGFELDLAAVMGQ